MEKTVVLMSKNFKHINPDSLEDYIKAGGFEALKKVVSMEKEEIIDTVTTSGLKGRGGAAYPVGRKLKQAEIEKAPSKVVVCNADEGEPGTFKDRALLEYDPFRVIEGMLISAFTVDADLGFIYMREEYPKLQRRMHNAIEAATKAGFLGENILGKDFKFNIKVVSGAGAYVCGEGTAIAESIEGKSGRPRMKPPYTKQKGVFLLPTCLNNVETLAILPLLFSEDGQTYVNCGTEDCKGSKLISISGKVKNPGVYEIPFGLTLREIIYEVAGGIKDNKKFKFVQLGGASGAIASEEQLDVKYTYDDLGKNGFSIGSGAFVVADETNSIIEYMETVQNFFVHESCGKCTPCREGNRQLAIIIDKLINKAATKEDLKTADRFGRIMKYSSFCGLGKACTAPLLSAIKLFREEFEEATN